MDKLKATNFGSKVRADQVVQSRLRKVHATSRYNKARHFAASLPGKDRRCHNWLKGKTNEMKCFNLRLLLINLPAAPFARKT
jgi:hypothetical protein